MKSKTNKTAPKFDKTKYEDISTTLPILFSSGDISLVDNSFDMIEGEFKLLSPRLIHEEIIGWAPKPDGEKGRKMISIKIYITDGIRTISPDHKIDTALSYFVRSGSRTWKPWSLPACFNLINGIRLERIRDVKEEIKNDIKWKAQELKEAAAKK